ncbi:MAG: hypothetical protein VKJ64_03085, partial [Leptolyngbyaceae bacterium]|nr:hypothetical protein [Leptolyngbyaceae bacterium]
DGRETFRYRSVKEFGDRITDFEILQDICDLSRIKGIRSMDDLNFSQKGNNAFMQAQVGNTFRLIAILDDIDINDLDKGNFKL